MTVYSGAKPKKAKLTGSSNSQVRRFPASMLRAKKE